MKTGVLPLILVLSVPSVGRTQELWGEVSIVGGAAAVASVTRVPARAGDTAWLLDFIRHHASDTPEDWLNAVLALQSYLRFVAAIAASPVAQPTGLQMPKGSRQDRNQLNSALGPWGLGVQQRGGALEVRLENLDDDEVAWLKELGVDRARVMATLNAGESATISLPRSLVPLPLPSLWQQERKQQTLTLIDVLGRRRWALRYAGLAALDDGTLRFVGERPVLFRWLGENDDAAWRLAAFGSRVRIRNGRVETPGGAGAAESWDRLVGRPQTDAESFVRRLLEREDGRLAAFYDAVGRLDRRRQAFALGEHLPASERVEFLERLYAHASSAWSANWHFAERPFDRLPFDPATALLLIDVSEDGFALPSWLASLVERVAESENWPDDPRETIRALRDQPADAVWTVGWLFAEPAQTTLRFRLLRFAQRQFREADRASAPSVEIALRCFKDLPALALSLERMGVRSADLLARVAWAGRRLTDAGDASDIGPLLARWQSALALVEQIQRRVRLDELQLAPLLTSLADRIPPHRERSRGLVGTWIVSELLPAFVTLDGAALERRALAAFAGTGRHSPVPLSWEGLSYTLDEAGPIVRSASAIREARRGPTLDDLVALHAVSVKLAGVTAKGDDLVQIATILRGLQPTFSTLPATGTGPHPMVEQFGAVVKEVERHARAGDADRARRELPKILDAIDAVTDAVVPALVYALAASPSRLPAELLAEGWIWHRLVPELSNSVMVWRFQPWRFPTMTARSGGGVRMVGSMLALDMALAYAMLPTTGATGVEASVEDTERAALVQSFPLHSPGQTWDASAALAGVAAGRRRLTDWRSTPGDRIGRREALINAGIDDRRANLIVWEAEREMPAYDRLTALDVYRLGTDAALSREWGGASTRLDGCLCLAAPERRSLELFRGRIGGGMITAAADLLLVLLEQISSLGLPAELLRPMLPIAAAHWFDNIQQRDASDWESLTTWPRRLSRLEIEEYLLRLTSEGYLVAVDGPVSR